MSRTCHARCNRDGALRLLDVLHTILGQVYCPEEVDLQNFFDIFHGEVINRFYGEDSVVAEQDIDLAKRRYGRVNYFPVIY
jgi:hypothetical protein